MCIVFLQELINYKTNYRVFPPQSGLKAVLQLLQWVWQNLSRGDSAHHIQSLSFIAKASLGLLQTYIRCPVFVHVNER